MNINFPIEKAIRKRVSVRNYLEQTLKPDIRTDLEAFIAAADNPFGKKVNFHFLDAEEIPEQEKLGTYGVIKGAKQYMGTTIKPEPYALEALGYELETVILYLAYKGLGTCWLGGTFNRNGFAGAMDIDEKVLFPIITPYGYPAEKRHLKEIGMRKLIKADQRKEWRELFYQEDFDRPLTKEAAGDLSFPLEMVRLGPSASNKQPWRILIKEHTVHFYEYKEPGYSKHFPYDIQRVDLGIAAAHFDLSVKERGVAGEFVINGEPTAELPKNMRYRFSWIRK